MQKKEYVETVAPLEKYAAQDYAIQKNELSAIKEQLDKAAQVYAKFIGEITDEQVLDCKSVFDTVSNKYNSAVEKYELEEYNGKIKIIADLFNSGALSGIASSSVTDTVNNDVVTAMEAYKFAAEFLNKKRQHRLFRQH